MIIVLNAPVTRASPLLTFSSDAPDLQQLHVGDTVSFTVSLSGLNPGDRLDYLSADVMFDGSLLGTPLVLTPGGIVPDALGFFSGVNTGLATGLYDILLAGTAPIDANGPFFTFTVQALRPGSGTLAFDPIPSSVGFDGQDAVLPDVLAGADLPYQIVGAQPVPEPTTLMLLTMSAGALTAWSLFGRRASRRSTN
jgi:hypothetical protein